jgi:hypothetical protein
MWRSRSRTGAVEWARDLVDFCFHWDEEAGEDLGDAESMKGTASWRREVRKGVSSAGVAVGDGSCERFRPQRRMRGPGVWVDIFGCGELMGLGLKTRA